MRDILFLSNFVVLAVGRSGPKTIGCLKRGNSDGCLDFIRRMALFIDGNRVEWVEVIRDVVISSTTEFSSSSERGEGPTKNFCKRW